MRLAAARLSRRPALDAESGNAIVLVNWRTLNVRRQTSRSADHSSPPGNWGSRSVRGLSASANEVRQLTGQFADGLPYRTSSPKPLQTSGPSPHISLILRPGRRPYRRSPHDGRKAGAGKRRSLLLVDFLGSVRYGIALLGVY